MRLVVLTMLVLAGCGRFSPEPPEIAPPLPPQNLAPPIAAVIDPDALIVEMGDFSRCRGPRGAGGSAGWSGTLVECLYPYTYAVELNAGGFSERLFLSQVTGRPRPQDGETPFRPVAVVTITDHRGRSYRFETAEGF